MAANSVRFEDTKTGQAITLAGSELPEPGLHHGGTVRKNVTRYPGDQVSVQILGVTDHDIELKGTLDDTWSGEAGRAEWVKETLEQMWRAQNVVMFEYRNMRRWGLLEVNVSEELAWRYIYTIKFQVLWVEPPGLTLIEIEETPADAASLTKNYADDLGDWVRNPPAAIEDTDLVSNLIFMIAAVQNETSALLNVLTGVVDYANLTRDLASEAIGFCRGIFNALSNMIALTVNTASDALAVGELDGASASRYMLESEARAHTSRAQAMLLYLKLANAIEPASARTHAVRLGETLRGIAKLYYDDFTRWVDIADANRLGGDDLTVGQILVIP